MLLPFAIFSVIHARSADAVRQDLATLAVRNADIARLERLGTSHHGVPIEGLRIGDDHLPGVRILGGHHGDESPGVEAPMHFAERLLNDRPAILQRIHLLIVPLVNPDAYVARTRVNAQGTDLNRNYGYAFRMDDLRAGVHAFSAPESDAIAFDNELHRYGSSLSYHAGASNIGYPYNYTVAALPSEALLTGYAKRYQALIADPAFWVTRGSQWYISHGDTNDYSFGYFGGVDMTVEVAVDKWPADDASVLPHLGAAIDWLQHSEDTVQVRVQDSDTGAPLPATVASSEIIAVCDPLRGEAELQRGSATSLSVSLPGYDGATHTLNAVEHTVTIALHAQTPLQTHAEPFSHRQSDALAFDLAGTASAATQAWLFRPGQDNVDLQCSFDGVLHCSAAANYRRAGHYALVLSDSAGTHFVSNAIYLAPDRAAHFDASRPLRAWRVTRGGPATEAPATASADAGGDIWQVQDGKQRLLGVAAINRARDPSTLTPVVKARGCAATTHTENAFLLDVICLAWFLRLRRRGT